MFQRKYIHLLVFCLSFWTIRADAQVPLPQRAAREAPEVTTWEEAVKLINSEKTTPNTRLIGFQELLKLGREDTRKGLLAIVASKDSGFAALASQQLVQEFPNDSKDTSALIKRHILTWTAVIQYIVLDTITQKQEGVNDYLMVAREVIEQKGSLVPNSPPANRSPLDIAISILARSDKLTDEELVLKTIQNRTESPWLWRSLANSGRANKKIIELAKTIYGDDRISQATRVAAASVVSSIGDGEAATYLSILKTALYVKL